MANNYLQFSEMLKLENEDQKKWALVRLHELQEARNEEFLESLKPEDRDKFEDYSEDLGFQWELEKDGLWLYAEEGGDPDKVAAFVKDFLAANDPEGVWTLSWAETCSKPRIGEFGGGAIFVTATAVEVLSTYEWLQDRRSSKVQ